MENWYNNNKNVVFDIMKKPDMTLSQIWRQDNHSCREVNIDLRNLKKMGNNAIYDSHRDPKNKSASWH